MLIIIKRTKVLIIMVINMIIMRFSMTKTLLTLMIEELTIVRIVAVIIMTYRRNNTEQKKERKA